ncbi:MAG: alpha/beta hydrolase [Chloroflexi bacterium]|nr:alpha/beta hydrolase [Chloroflexota bacterium]
MRQVGQLLLAAVGLVALGLLAVPLAVPLPPAAGTALPGLLADPDSRFVEVNGLSVHYKEAGGGEPNLILLHGFGASLFSWQQVVEPLGSLGRVVSFDRPAFGLTERPLPGQWQGQSPYSSEAQVALTVGLMDALGMEQAVLVGNSAGGTVAVRTALEHPERVQALVLVDAAIYAGGGSPTWLTPLFRTPQGRWWGPFVLRQLLPTRGDDLIRSAWYDESRVAEATLAGYRKPLQAHHWDRALWELVAASSASDLGERLAQVTVPSVVITGDSDAWVPTEQSIRLAGELPNARLAVLPDCGHVPQEECPGPFLEALSQFLGDAPWTSP